MTGGRGERTGALSPDVTKAATAATSKRSVLFISRGIGVGLGLTEARLARSPCQSIRQAGSGSPQSLLAFAEASPSPRPSPQRRGRQSRPLWGGFADTRLTSFPPQGSPTEAKLRSLERPRGDGFAPSPGGRGPG